MAGGGVGLVVLRPGEGDVKARVGVDEGRKLVFILVPADFAVIDGEAVALEQQLVHGLVHQLEVLVRVADGVIDELHGLVLGALAALGAGAEEKPRQRGRREKRGSGGRGDGGALFHVSASSGSSAPTALE